MQAILTASAHRLGPPPRSSGVTPLSCNSLNRDTGPLCLSPPNLSLFTWGTKTLSAQSGRLVWKASQQALDDSASF